MMRFMPSLRRETLKLMRSARGYLVIFKYERTCASWMGVKLCTDFNSTIKDSPTKKSNLPSPTGRPL
jgi:hypothetical protein